MIVPILPLAHLRLGRVVRGRGPAVDVVRTGPQPAKGVKFSQVSAAELKEWLTYLASDDLKGRQIYTEGYGMAAQYIAQNLKDWGVKPINGSYFQPVRTRGYRVTRNSSVTLTLPDGPRRSSTAIT